jgi:tRNA 2-selenouridine synthase
MAHAAFDGLSMMTAPAVGVAEVPGFDTVIDTRSPAEFAEDRLPGAINLPVLDDAERARVGTLYTQVSPFEARKVGAALVARRIAGHLEGPLRDQPRRWSPLVYCWRGGQRSGAFVTWLRLIGWDARQLEGGYQTWRRHVITRLDALPPALHFEVVSGPTGSGKTRLLQALAHEGAQVLDLEALAGHKGSVLGAVPGIVQPSQKGFETLLAQALAAFDPQQPVFVEAESRRIGRLHLPGTLVERMRASPCTAIEADAAERVRFLLRDYAYLGDDRSALQGSIGHLKGLQSNETLARWMQWAAEGELSLLFTELIALHYDPAYRRSQRSSYVHDQAATGVRLEALDDAGFAAAARELLRPQRQRAA